MLDIWGTTGGLEPQVRGSRQVHHVGLPLLAEGNPVRLAEQGVEGHGLAIDVEAQLIPGGEGIVRTERLSYGR